MTTLNFALELPKADEFRCKFILIKELLKDRTTQWGVICKPEPFHEDISASLMKQKREFGVFGGGQIALDAKNKSLTVFGKSLKYGKAVARKVDDILLPYCIEHGLNFINKLHEDSPY